MTMAVPENSMAENEFKPLDDEDDELLPQVPIFHMPLAEEFCVHEHSRMMINSSKNIINSVLHQSASVDSDKNHDDHHPSDCCVNLVVPDGSCCDDLEYNFLGSDQTDLCEFGMDMEMESIIGQGLGLYCSPSSDRDFKQHDTLDSREIILDNNGDNAAPLSSWLWASRIVKVEEADHDYEEEEEEDRSDDHDQAKSDIAAAPKVKLEVVEEPDPSWDTIELNIDHYHDQPDEDHGDCNIQTTTGAQEATLIAAHDVKTELDFGSILGATSSTVDCSNYETKLSLRLNYEDVLSAWSDRGSFRASDSRPATVPDHHDCSSEGAGGSYDVGLVPDLSLSSGPFGGEQIGQVPMMNGGDQDSCRHGGGREARVLRYREKRRTRLFSKKIRYEVRKLNAEKRPRMKGRFVKRTSGMSSD